MEFSIEIGSQLEEFKHKLDGEDRIILSAPFGEGKSFFLNEFRKQYGGEFYMFTIYPVNYSVSDNEQIMEYIKRDIIYQLHNNHDKSFKHIDWKTIVTESVKTTIHNWNIAAYLEGLFEIPKIINDATISSSQYIKDFATSGSIYDQDAFTAFIVRALNEIRSTYHKKTILVIEDLDRMQPSSIFKILNIFGSHLDRPYLIDSEINNKFGFDKVITIMNYKQVESSFLKWYGEGADYKGYMAKFMSGYPFNYCIRYRASEIVADKLFKLYGCSLTDSAHICLVNALNNYSVRELERIYVFDPNTLIKRQATKSCFNGCVPLRFYFIEAYNVAFGLDLISVQLEGDNNASTSGCLFIAYSHITMPDNSPIRDRSYYFNNNQTFEVKQQCNINDFTVGVVVDYGNDSTDLSNYTNADIEKEIRKVRAVLRTCCYGDNNISSQSPL